MYPIIFLTKKPTMKKIKQKTKFDVNKTCLKASEIPKEIKVLEIKTIMILLK